MNKSATLIVVLSLIVSSCSSIPEAHHDVEREPSASKKDVSCIELVRAITDQKKSSITNIVFTEKTGLEITKEELSELNLKFSREEFEASASTIRSIYLYSQGDAKISGLLLEDFKSQLNKSHAPSKDSPWEKFVYHQKRVEEKKKAFSTEKKALNFEKLYYGCKTQIKKSASSAGAQEIQAAKRLTYAITVGNLSSAIVTYSAVHWEEEKDAKWYNELIFSLGVSTALSFISSKLVVANPNLNPWTGKMPLTFLNNAISDAAVSGLYGYLFKEKESKLDQKIEDLKKDPEANKKLNELITIAKENHLFEKHLEKTSELFKDKEGSIDDPNLTIDDVDFDASRELLIAAIAEKDYEENSGPLSTGSRPVDRYAFHRLYNIASVPASIGVSLVMYDQMCMAESPKQGFLKAVGTYMGVSILFDALYFKMRKEAIHQ